jgi:hypothetical protein
VKEEPPGPRVTFFGAAEAIASFGLAPGPAVGGQVGVGLRRGAASLEASGRIETTTQPVQVDSGDRIEATVFSGFLAPCAALGPWLGCLTGRVGAFQGRAPDVVNPSLGTSAFGAVGARAGYVLYVTRVVAFRALGFVELPVVRTALVIDRATVWTAPPLMGGLMLGAAFYAL